MLSKRSRLNKARRLWKQKPLFAHADMVALLGVEYGYEQFIADITYNKKPKTKSKKPVYLYLRYQLAKEALSRLAMGEATESDYRKIAACSRLSRPVLIKVERADIVSYCAEHSQCKSFIKDGVFVGYLPATVHINTVKEIIRMANTATPELFIKEFKKQQRFD